MKQTIIIDADFLNVITSASDGEKFFEDIVRSLDFQPLIHQYVADNELFNNNSAKRLIDDGIIQRVTYGEIFDDDFEVFYKQSFADYYYQMNNKEIPCSISNIFKYREAGHNLGEIHSCIMANFLNVSYLMSNDRGAKDLANTRVPNLHVMSIDDFIVYAAEHSQKLSHETIEFIIDVLISIKNSNNRYIIEKHRAKELRRMFVDC